jgi:hypothetical protein
MEAFDHIGSVDDEIRCIVARNWPHLLSKLPPEDEWDPRVARAPVDHEHGGLYGPGAESVQGFLAGMSRGLEVDD